jgi:hypothetical protein
MEQDSRVIANAMNGRGVHWFWEAEQRTDLCDGNDAVMLEVET